MSRSTFHTFRNGTQRMMAGREAGREVGREVGKVAVSGCLVVVGMALGCVVDV